MSTFQGRMIEYQCLSIDCFDSDNLRSKMFFLSHCHEDHMKGLGAPEFLKLLRNNDYKIYMQKITAHLLLSDSRYANLRPHVVELDIHFPYPLSVTQNNRNFDFVVTLLPAGHCPGSVMFLFEGDEGNVLYTGDIRLTKDDLEQFPALKSGNSVKPLKSIYFDSTFCIKNTFTIPSRQESRDVLIALIESWLNANDSNKILLSCAAKYGQEYLFCQLSEYFGMKIHIPAYKNEIYSKIPEIAKHVTTVSEETRIHACSYWINEKDNSEITNYSTHGNKTCPDCRFWDPNVRTIKPSMMYFAQTKSVNKTIHKDGRVFRIKYSSHSSLSEIREILSYLKPQRAYPNVMPYKSNYKEIMDAIRDLLPKTPVKNKVEQPVTPYLATTGNLFEKRCFTFKRRYVNRSRCSTDSTDSTSPSPKKLKSSLTPVKIRGQSESNFDFWNNIQISSDSESLTKDIRSTYNDDDALSLKSGSDTTPTRFDDISYHSDNEITYQSSTGCQKSVIENNQPDHFPNADSPVVDVISDNEIAYQSDSCLSADVNNKSGRVSVEDVISDEDGDKDDNFSQDLFGDCEESTSNQPVLINCAHSDLTCDNSQPNVDLMNSVLSDDSEKLIAFADKSNQDFVKIDCDSDNSSCSIRLDLSDHDNDDCVEVEEKSDEILSVKGSSSLEILDEFVVDDKQKLTKSLSVTDDKLSDDVCVIYSKIEKKQKTEFIESGWLNKSLIAKNAKR